LTITEISRNVIIIIIIIMIIIIIIILYVTTAQRVTKFFFFNRYHLVVEYLLNDLLERKKGNIFNKRLIKLIVQGVIKERKIKVRNTYHD